MKIGVVGAGVMGAGIAQSLAVAGLGEVICVDTSPEAIADAKGSIQNGRFGLDRAVELGRISKEVAGRALSAITFATDRTGLSDAHVVVEAIYEDLGAKIHLFRELDHELQRGTILASNTSGLSIQALAA